MSYSDVPEVINFDQVQKIQKLGEGGFGQVFKVKYRGITYALKQLHPPRSGSKDEHRFRMAVESLTREAKALAALGRSEFVVQFIGACRDPQSLGECLLMEFVDGMDLARLIERKKTMLTWPVRRSLTLGITRGIEFIHSKNILHRDIKSDNVLVGLMGEQITQVKLADFGICRLEQDLFTQQTMMMAAGVGSVVWMAPELLNQRFAHPSLKSDVYSLGVVMWEIAALTRPYEKVATLEEIANMKHSGIIETLPSGTPAAYQNILRRCQHPDSQLRPYASELVQIMENPLFNPTTSSNSLGMALSYTGLGDFPLNTAAYSTVLPELTPLTQIDTVGDTLSRFKLETEPHQPHQLHQPSLTPTVQDDKLLLSKLASILKIQTLDNPGAIYLAAGDYFSRGSSKDYTQALVCYSKAYDSGMNQSLAKLGVIYKNGLGLAHPDPAQGFKYFEKSAQLGDPYGHLFLGECYYYGQGTHPDRHLARLHLTAAANRDIPAALHLLGIMALQGDDMVKDSETALHLFNKAAGLKYAPAQFELGRIYFDGLVRPRDLRRATKWIGLAAAQDHPGALYIRGYMLEFGDGLDLNLTKAIEFYEKSSALGCAEAQLSLGKLFSAGKGVACDLTKAFRMFLLAADAGNDEGRYRVARCYHDGAGVSQNFSLSFKYFLMAAQAGHAQAQFGVGLQYELGQGPDLDLSQAAAWYHKAALQGLVIAYHSLGLLYRDGRGANQDYDEAFKWFQLGAQHGRADSQLEMGLLYYNGLGVYQDLAAAYHWISKAAFQNNSEAQKWVGILHKNGQGVPQDSDRARDWFSRSELQGQPPSYKSNVNDLIVPVNEPNALSVLPKYDDPDHQFRMALALDKGENGLEKNNEAALQWCLKAANQGHMLAQNWLGFRLGNDPSNVSRMVEAAAWFEKSAIQGNAAAQYNLARCYLNGEGVPSDPSLALSWFTRAAEQDQPQAQYKVGRLLAHGAEGVPVDSELALVWLLKAASHHHRDAQFECGLLYLKLIPPDLVTALRMFRDAANQDHPRAAYQLGVCYHQGLGCLADINQAIKWYRAASRLGEPEAQRVLGKCYLEGAGVSKDPVEAVRYFTMSANNNDASAQVELGLAYYQGRGVSQDFVLSFQWFLRAAQNGNAIGQYWTGFLLGVGKGTALDESAAVDWLQRSANQNNPSSQYLLARCYDKGSGVPRDQARAFSLFEQAANQGHVEAMFEVGRCYYAGRGTNLSLASAQRWFAKAASQGHQEARTYL